MAFFTWEKVTIHKIKVSFYVVSSLILVNFDSRCHFRWECCWVSSKWRLGNSSSGREQGFTWDSPLSRAWKCCQSCRQRKVVNFWFARTCSRNKMDCWEPPSACGQIQGKTGFSCSRACPRRFDRPCFPPPRLLPHHIDGFRNQSELQQKKITILITIVYWFVFF